MNDPMSNMLPNEYEDAIVGMLRSVRALCRVVSESRIENRMAEAVQALDDVRNDKYVAMVCNDVIDSRSSHLITESLCQSCLEDEMCELTSGVKFTFNRISEEDKDLLLQILTIRFLARMRADGYVMSAGEKTLNHVLLTSSLIHEEG